MSGLDVERVTLEARLTVNPDDKAAARRLGDVKEAIKAEEARVAAIPEIEVVGPEMEVETATLPKRTRKS